MLVWTASVRHRGARMSSLRSQTEETVHGTDYPNWNGYVETYFPASWGECGGGTGLAQEVAAQGNCEVFPGVTAGKGGNRSVRQLSSLGPSAAVVWARSKAHPAPVC